MLYNDLIRKLSVHNGQCVSCNIIWIAATITLFFLCRGICAFSGPYGYEIITLKSIKPSESIPIIVKYLQPDKSVNRKIFNATRLSSTGGSLTKETINIKAGVGSVVSEVSANADFEIIINGEKTGKIVELISDVPKKYYEGQLGADEVWTSDFEYYITGDLYVKEGLALLIEKGTRIYIDSKINIFIDGGTNINGTKDEPVVFTSFFNDKPWGGIVFGPKSSISRFTNCIITNGGGNDEYIMGHSMSQAVVNMLAADVTFDECYFIDNTGKAFGATDSRVTISNSLISRCDTGGEFHTSLANITNTVVSEIPDNTDNFIDDDNDGFYFLNPHSSSDEPSIVDGCYFIKGKDDAIDHNGAKLIVKNTYIDGFTHEGIAASTDNFVKVFNSLITNCNQGIEAGYGEPEVMVDHCLIIRNDAGIRFGDSYDIACEGNMEIRNTIIIKNGININNFVNLLEGPFPGGINLGNTLLDNSDYKEECLNCVIGEALFNENYLLVEGSPGKAMASDGLDIGLVDTLLNGHLVYLPDDGTIPKTFHFKSFPNPFSIATNLCFELNEYSFTEIVIINSLGRQIEKIILGYVEQGRQCVRWQPVGLSKSIYRAILITNGQASGSINIVYQ